MKVTMDDVLTLIETVSESNLTKFQFEDEDFSIAMTSSKKKAKQKKQEHNSKTEKKQKEQKEKQSLAAKEERKDEQMEQEDKNEQAFVHADEEKEKKEVCSPLVGTFYAAKEEGAAPFVQVGDKVEKGQVIGIVEAMKLMNEVESEYDGIVAEILVENEEMVEYGQPLISILSR